MSMENLCRKIELETEIRLLEGSIAASKTYVEHLLHRHVSPDTTVEKHLNLIKHCRRQRWEYKKELAILTANEDL